MDRLYYTYLIIKESLDYIPAIEIKGQLEEKYQIKVDVKTVYQAIRNINELSKYVYQKEIIKTKHRKGYSIDEEFFNDGQFQYLWDSVLFNNDLNEDEVNALLTKLQTLSSSKQLSRIQNQPRKKNIQRKPKQKSFIKTMIILVIFVVFIFIPVSELIINTVTNIVETTDEATSSFDGNGNTDLSSFNLNQDSSRGDYNQNFTNSDGGAFVYQNKLYISLNGQLIKYDAHFENSEVLEESSCDHIYVDDRGCFYENDNDFIFLDFNGKRKTLLNEVSHCYVLDQKIFYIKDETLYCLTIDENMNEIDNKKMVDDTYEFNVDDQNQHILYTNNDYESKLIDFNGTSLKQNVDNYGNAYFIDGFLYYREYDGIYKTDFSSDEGELVQAASDIYRFGVGQDEENEKVIVYGENYDNVLNAYFDDDSYALYDDARDFYIIGDKVIFFTYDDHYTRHYFISSYDGEYAPFEE